VTGNQRDAARAPWLIPQHRYRITFAGYSIELNLAHALPAPDRREQRELVAICERRIA
jgi:hypothetical protein